MLEALLPKILKISDPISALLAELWSGFTSQDGEFQEDRTELNLEVFIALQKFEDENTQHISIHTLFIIIIIIHASIQ